MYNTNSNIWLLVEGVPAMHASHVNLNAAIDINAPIERVWPLFSDTDRVNRLIGLPAFERTEPDQDLTRMVQGHYMGVPVAWREYPFEWVFEQWFQVERAFAPPLPVDRIVTGARLTPLPGERTRVDVWVRIAPRNVVGWLGARIYIGRKMLGDLLRIYRQLGELAANAAQVAPPPRRKPAVNAGRLERAAERLRQFGLAPALIERLAGHLSSADDPDVLRMRPFALADAWGAARLDVLRLFLYATRAGMLDLEWDVICPNCRGASMRATTLSDLSRDAHCTSCNIRYDVNFDESVELRFSVNPDIREAIDMPYCIGGPANTRHIMSQLWLPPRSTKELQLRLPPGAYRLRSRQLPAVASIEASAGPRTTHVRFGEDIIEAETPALNSGDATLTLENTTGSSLLVVLEQSAWSAQAASAALVTALAEFRQLFSSEVLAPGLGVSIRNLTFLFSDLKDSTAIYDTIGDSPAYARVRDHFDVMNRIIADWRGALVKTIGDAVMAVFPSVEDAIAASLEIQREFTAGEIARGNPALKVKLGLHRGPCIAVNANDLLDYFGSTVNIAARVQAASVGGDIVVTHEILADPGVQRVVERAAPTIESFERELKGFSQAFTLYRLWVHDPEDPELEPQENRKTMVPR
jgi:class 3 adenylate cyclase